MHILVVNDDGPPSQKCSPYLYPFVKTLQDAGHLVSVVIPDSSRSWIGKAHIIGETLKATYVSPEALLKDSSGSVQSNHASNDLGSGGLQKRNGASSAQPDTSTPDSTRDCGTGHPWVLVANGTPAACTQLGIYCLFPERPPVDLVVSGPNHGRNASTIYTLASGTVGGALEAVTCGKKSIALSFASKEKQPVEIIQAAARLSVKLIEHIASHWPAEGVELYNINVPMRLDVEDRPIVYTRTLPNTWSKCSLYGEVDARTIEPDNNDVGDKDRHEGSAPTERGGQQEPRTRHFKWAPELSDIQRSVECSQVGTDAYTVMNGCISVTPLMANFSHASGFGGELKL
ncbi:5'/3'-nucleotidase SurE [Helicocarpus griseus UAMH5409]|uniref:5'/3'-nucleotidase SurE n=1 Tax=Helicocarpus griseus UAMH5409 TaxID=1447875 RepID=A0A2B7Y1J0_9EURO|nr:5'/3'-nucleotidase SurE [Helicocarpus griseus UAMH5409]